MTNELIRKSSPVSGSILAVARSLRPLLGKPGLSTKRACDIRDILLAYREAQTAKRHVRVYSDAGFVPNRYKYPVWIQYVDANRTENGWQFLIGWTGAQRSHGAGKLMVKQ